MAEPCEDRWTVAEGVLKNESPHEASGPRATCTRRRSSRTSRSTPRSSWAASENSGLYIRGRYELQLQLATDYDARRAASTYPGLLMDIYGWKRADVYAGNPPGEWQILNVVVVGNHITATLNGKRVHDNAVLPAFTGGALDNDELAPGPIMIQGDHSHVGLRKLVVTPITKSGT